MKMMKISDEDACNRNGKLSSSPCLIPSTYCHYFHTLLMPPRKLTFPWKPVASLNFHLKFSILIYYSCPSSPICLEILPSYSTIKIGSITLSLHFGIRSQQQANKAKDLKICEYNIWQLSIKIRWWYASLAFWILAKVTTYFNESLYFLNIIFV